MVSRFAKFSGLFKLLSEIELVFGLWSIAFLLIAMIVEGPKFSFSYLNNLNFRDVLFVFVIMNIASTKPIIESAQFILSKFVSLIPLRFEYSFFIVMLAIGPMLGSFITEPAAMAVCAVILRKGLFNKNISLKFKYAILSLLFVNISIGGTLTHFAAPPILIVAHKWGLTSSLLLRHLGYKSMIAILFSTFIFLFIFKKELSQISIDKRLLKERTTPNWLIIAHLVLLFFSVYFAHTPVALIFIFFFFIFLFKKTSIYQSHSEMTEALKVSFFMWGLIVLGGMQAWWLKMILSNLSETKMILGATALTAITDNAALTYLGGVSNLGENLRWALLAGAVAGGGLTVIANAPNPIGLSYLKESIDKEGVSAFLILKWSLIPTIISVICFMFLSSL
jgi:Na+/H+ antiporter NhaD/arsenite permease-like protein